jgi:hypothetical protein
MDTVTITMSREDAETIAYAGGDYAFIPSALAETMRAVLESTE